MPVGGNAGIVNVQCLELGATLLNGKAEVLSFGGQVMKNVAGYDVARALAGSMGVLGVIAEVSLKVLPTPRATATLRFETPQQADALAAMQAGDLDVTVFQNAAAQGGGALDAAVKLSKGEAVDQKVYIPFQLVTPENIDQFLNGAGALVEGGTFFVGEVDLDEFIFVWHIWRDGRKHILRQDAHMNGRRVIGNV